LKVFWFFARGLVGGARQSKGPKKKAFFFEKKKQKTFIHLGLNHDN